MTNKEIESYRNSYKVVNGIGFCRVNNDITGIPVMWFIFSLLLLTKK